MMVMTTLLVLHHHMQVKETKVHNPYRKVNFNTFSRHLSNFHCHTTFSDGFMEPHVIIDKYHAAGFSIIALTDHDTSHKNYVRTLYPWTEFELVWDEVRDGVSKTWPTGGTGGWVTDNNNRGNGLDWENRDPNQLGMLAIEATELTASLGVLPQDVNAYDCGIPEQDSNLSTSVGNIASAGGWAVLVHPGRSGSINTSAIATLKTEHEDTLKAIEVFHRSNAQPTWMNNWDTINRGRDWDKPFYGMGGDDAHLSEQLYEGYNQMYLPELTHEAFMECVDSGAYVFSDQYVKGDFYTSSGFSNVFKDTAGQMENPAPFVTRISRTGKTIKVEALHADTIVWLDDSGNVISETDTVSIDGLTHKFVRCKLDNEIGTTLTQPFGLKEENVTEDALFMV